MNRAQEIDNLLKYMYDGFREYNIPINLDNVYIALCNYGFDEKETQVRTDSLFPLWIERYKDKPNLTVEQDPRQLNFLQFYNQKTDESKHLKLYVSLAPNAYYEGINLIFDFIEKNNMKTSSKVSDRFRSDEIVLRLEDNEDVEKVISFINNNQFLVENARPTNPFLNREGIVGIGYDDTVSYNSTIAYFLVDYLKVTKTPGYDDFVKYFYTRYVNLFQNKSELKDFVNSEHFRNNCERIKVVYPKIFNHEIYLENNYKIVFEAIFNNIYGDSYKNLYGCVEESKKIFENSVIVDKYQLLVQYICYAYFKKFNYNANSVVETLARYSSGDQNAITRDNNFRFKFMYNLRPEDIVNITNGDIVSYVNDTIAFEGPDYEKGFAETQDLSKPKDFGMFIEGLRETYRKYGKDHLILCFSELLRGNFNVITNDSGFRKYFMNNYNTGELVNLANQYVNSLLGNNATYTGDLGQMLFNVLQSDYGFDNPTEALDVNDRNR